MNKYLKWLPLMFLSISKALSRISASSDLAVLILKAISHRLALVSR